MTTEPIADNLQDIAVRIRAACQRVGRDPDDVQLVCVSKTVDAGRIEQAYRAGARHFGENYGQHLRDKARELEALTDLRWHFIGPLQRNKVRYVVGTARLIHSVHSVELLEAIESRAARMGLVQEYLVQLNLAREPSKSGVAAEQLETILDAAGRCSSCRCLGLMTMPPFFDDPEGARPFFSELRAIREQFSKAPRPHVDLRHLSMGMTGDFEVAIEEGATLVRIGTALFGARPGARQQ